MNEAIRAAWQHFDIVGHDTDLSGRDIALWNI
jgi:hypothetical protein